MNVASSRSHTLLVLTLLRREGGEETPVAGGGPGRPCQEVISHLSLVDLAGSERSVASVLSGFQGKSTTRFQEAVNVNQSLFVLRRVITALSKREASKEAVTHVPYRESKLTSLLQNSLGGNSYLVMFACLAPSERQDDENLSTLQYASQAACIRNQPVVNLDPKDQMIQQLEARLQVAHDYLRRMLQLSELPEDLLEEERKAASATSGRTRRPRARAKTNPQHPHPTPPPKLRTGPRSDGTDAGNAGGRVPHSARAKTWTGTEQRWGFKDDDQKDQKNDKQKVESSRDTRDARDTRDTVSESSRESSKSRAKPLKKVSHDSSSATSTLSRIVQGREELAKWVPSKVKQRQTMQYSWIINRN